jgi:DNA polymerase III subunit delta
MSPEQFVARMAKQSPGPAYLFLGPESYQRRACKTALLQRVLPGDLRAEGLTQIDLENTKLPEVLDDARSLSLFSRDRVIWVSSAELALPRRLTSAGDEAGDGERPEGSEVAAYLRAPTPGTVLVFECSRYDFAGDDRSKLERVQKFYSAVPVTVEFHQFTAESSRFLAQQLARENDLKIGGAELAALLDAVGGDAARISSEIEKLALFVGRDSAVTMDDLAALVPNAAQSTIFALVHALGRRDRAAALTSLDILIREGEYLPLALAFLSTQFRLALAAKEARVSSVPQALGLFAKLGVRMWRDRAEQVMGTANTFTKERLAQAVALIYETDKRFREGYKDDRIVMECLVIGMTN